MSEPNLPRLKNALKYQMNYHLWLEQCVQMIPTLNVGCVVCGTKKEASLGKYSLGIIFGLVTSSTMFQAQDTKTIVCGNQGGKRMVKDH